MGISAQNVQELRQRTGAGMMDCKRALSETSGDMDKAAEYLRKKGVSSADKKSSRTASQGAVVSYIHGGGRIGVLIEVNCETDFVARNEIFQNLTRDLAMQVAAASPLYVKREDVPANVLEKEREIFSEQAKEQGKPENIVAKIVDGKVDKWLAEICLLEQGCIKDPDTTVGEMIKTSIATIGENIVVKRFTRYELGQLS